MNISYICSSCKTPQTVSLAKGVDLNPCDCGSLRFPYATDKFLRDHTLHQCPLCGCGHLYRQKDFNRKLGIFLITLGVILSYWTYGLSLVFVTLIDWLISRQVKELGICYKCHTQFRDTSKIGDLKPFNLNLHDYYKSINASGSGNQNHHL